MDTDDRSTPPLGAAELEEAGIRPERHRVEPPEPGDTALLDLDIDDGSVPPEVTTRLVRGSGLEHPWRVEVAVERGRLRRARPPVPEVIQIDRRVLAADAITAVAGSVPDIDDRFSARPRRRELPEPYQIRFGDLRYAPTTLFKPDGRRPYYDETYPWRCLVRITTPRGWSGSGVLIGPRHVLTASHCVDWTPGWLTVDVMYSNSSSLQSAAGIYVYAESKVGSGTIPDDESDEDYAVVVLDQPLGSRFGWLGSRTYNSGWDDETSAWHSIGYPQDWSGNGEIAAWQTDFFLNELGADFGSARLIRSETFDNWKGQSGSPVFGFWSDGPYAVGVVSGEDSDYNYISGGSLLPSLVNRARAERP